MALTPYDTNILQALKWQQNKAPNITSLIQQKANWYQQFNTTFWQNWETTVFDLRTAGSFGILIWCIILGVPSQLFGLFGNSRAWAYGPNRQNFVYNEGGTPPADANLIGGNFAGGGATTILNPEEAIWALQLRYAALVSNGRIAFVNFMLNWIFNSGEPWDFAAGRYFYVADCTVAGQPATGVSIFRTDWQGNQLLYVTPRTNLILNSGAVGSTNWTTSISGAATAPVFTLNAATAPDGSTTASRVQMTLNGGVTTGDMCSFSQAVGVSSGSVSTNSIWLKSNTGANQTLILRDDAAPGIPNTLITVTPTWQRFSQSILHTGETSARLKIWLRGASGSAVTADILAWGGQVEAGNVLTSYIPTTTVPVTVTDYTLNAITGAVAMAVAPTLGPPAAQLFWSGSWNGGTTVGQQLFGTGNGVQTAFTLTPAPGSVAPIANAFDIEYRIGPAMDFSSQFINLLNSSQFGITPQFAGSKYNVVIGP